MVSAVATAGIFAAGACGAPAVSDRNAPESGPAEVRVGLLLAGPTHDGGFMEAGYNGAKRAEQQLGAQITVVDRVAPRQPELEAAMRDLARGGVDLVVAQGGQNNAAAKVVAAEFPQTTFVVTQSDVTGPNLASYEVLQEQSAWLAGAAAGLLTKSGVVGHMSGIRPVPGLKGRAAFVDGVAHTNPAARVLTNFSGDQDDIPLARRIATAELDAGADYIFTMLNAGRPGVAEAIRATGKGRQFGNVRDFTADDPAVFAGSAVADSGEAVFRAIGDFAHGRLHGGENVRIGLESPEAVRLTLAPDVPDHVRAELDRLGRQIVDGEVEVKTTYTGPEFPNP
ncbi:BMP family ABC transporter substrate-binding protein [Saccharopolyspora elongata]|uniref:BMP family ABC transporter substrate-binding protein n=1 Tax=Saccharopolyspora elongata TaxID=2530387 RepID=A0A4R4YTL9_9PSEU|nr:BMP family ABC transporter substrate-binding protein [Saccharopolyspora elongata]